MIIHEEIHEKKKKKKSTLTSDTFNFTLTLNRMNIQTFYFKMHPCTSESFYDANVCTSSIISYRVSSLTHLSPSLVGFPAPL